MFLTRYSPLPAKPVSHQVLPTCQPKPNRCLSPGTHPYQPKPVSHQVLSPASLNLTDVSHQVLTPTSLNHPYQPKPVSHQVLSPASLNLTDVSQQVLPPCQPKPNRCFSPGTHPYQPKPVSHQVLTPASLNLTDVPDAGSNSLASFGLIQRSITAGSPRVLKLIRSR